MRMAKLIKGRMNLNIQELDYIDNIILNNISETGMFDDIKTSGYLHCPRTLLLSKLEGLINTGYVVRDGENLKLSESGIAEMIPLSKNHFSVPTENFKMDSSFDWHKPYIPPAGWDSRP